MKRLLAAAAVAALAWGCEDHGVSAPPATGGSAQAAAAPAFAPAGSWSAPAELVPGSRRQRCPLQQVPALVRRGQGVLAVWLTRELEGGEGDVGRWTWAELAPGAAAWTAPRPLDGDARAYFQDDPPQLAALPDGSVAAVWLHPVNTSERRMTIATLPAGAQAWTAPAPAPEPLSRHIRLAAGADGVLHAVYSGRQGPTYARRSADGTWSAGEPLRDLVSRAVTVEMMGGPDQAVRTSGGAPMIAAGADGSVLVAWWDDQLTLNPMGALARDLMWRVRSPDGRWSPSRRFDAARSEQSQHSAIGADGSGFLLAYAGSDHAGRVARLTPGADRWHAPQPLGEGRMFEPQFAQAGDGAALAHWRGFVVGRESRFSLAGSDGAGGLRPLPSSPAEQFDLFSHAAAVDGAGRLVAVFDDPQEPQGCAGLAWSRLG